MSLLLNLIGGCNKLFEFVFRDKITPLACNLNMIPSCQILSKAFDISKKTLLTSTVRFSSKAV